MSVCVCGGSLLHGTWESSNISQYSHLCTDTVYNIIYPHVSAYQSALGYYSLLHALRAALLILHVMFGLPEMETPLCERERGISLWKKSHLLVTGFSRMVLQWNSLSKIMSQFQYTGHCWNITIDSSRLVQENSPQRFIWIHWRLWGL